MITEERRKEMEKKLEKFRKFGPIKERTYSEQDEDVLNLWVAKRQEKFIDC